MRREITLANVGSIPPAGKNGIDYPDSATRDSQHDLRSLFLLRQLRKDTPMTA